MNLPFFIARRYFFAKRTGRSLNVINIITRISVGGFTVGAMALIVVLSVFNGFEEVVKSLYSSFDADLRITPTAGKVFDPADERIQQVKQLPQLAAYSDILEENALLRYGDQQHIATIKGVEQSFMDYTELDSFVRVGLPVLEKDSQSYAMVGVGVAVQLSLNPLNEFTDLQVYVPRRGKLSSINPENAFMERSIRPSSVFAIQEELDDKYVVVPLSFARQVLERSQDISALELAVKSDAEVADVQVQVQQLLGEDFEVKNRFQQHELLYRVMKSEKLATYLILAFILLIAAFNMIGSLYMQVLEKRKDLALLASIGTPIQTIKRIFLNQGLLVALYGGVIGMALGGLICWIQLTFGLVKIGGNGDLVVDVYPVSMHAEDFLLVLGTVVLLGFVTSLYPAYTAGKKAQTSLNDSAL